MTKRRPSLYCMACPFCGGGQAHVAITMTGNNYAVECPNCGATGPVGSADGAAEKWNAALNQPTPDPIAQDVVTHELKTWPLEFAAVVDGRKRFEFRLDDRQFELGDRLVLCRFNPVAGRYSGEQFVVRVTYIVRGQFGVPDGYVVMGIEPWEQQDGTEGVEGATERQHMRKVVQVFNRVDAVHRQGVFIALCNDGTIWRWEGHTLSWAPWDSLPPGCCDTEEGVEGDIR